LVFICGRADCVIQSLEVEADDSQPLQQNADGADQEVALLGTSERQVEPCLVKALLDFIL
jgi:hypothetical protein